MSGRIEIAPEVLETIVRLTTLAVPGVARLAAGPGVARFLRHDGIQIEIVGESVQARVHVIAESDVNLLSLGRQIQSEVARAIENMTGMKVSAVDVYVEDVITSLEKRE